MTVRKLFYSADICIFLIVLDNTHLVKVNHVVIIHPIHNMKHYGSKRLSAFKTISLFLMSSFSIVSSGLPVG